MAAMLVELRLSVIAAAALITVVLVGAGVWNLLLR